jgi:hypothetical protein
MAKSKFSRIELVALSGGIGLLSLLALILAMLTLLISSQGRDLRWGDWSLGLRPLPRSQQGAPPVRRIVTISPGRLEVADERRIAVFGLIRHQPMPRTLSISGYEVRNGIAHRIGIVGQAYRQPAPQSLTIYANEIQRRRFGEIVLTNPQRVVAK